MKRCLFCHAWFRPYPQTAKIQKACQRAICRRTRHRQACLLWNRKHSDYDRSRRAKIRSWAREYPSYWQLYRTTQPEYKEIERQRMRQWRQTANRRKTRRYSVVEEECLIIDGHWFEALRSLCRLEVKIPFCEGENNGGNYN